MNCKRFAYLLVTTFLLHVVNVKCCEKSTFRDAKIKASKYFSLVDDPDDIKLEDALTGCITSTDQLKDAVQIVVKNQEVPILHEGAVQDLQWLHVLKLEENGIEEIKPGAFQNLPTIATISLAKNQIKAIPEGVFNNMEVKRLLLNDNSISTIAPGAFDNMPNLNRIDLDHNKLQQWNQKWFTNTPNIHFLSATFNQITELPANAFKNFKGKHEQAGKSPVVTSIYLANNKIKEIHATTFKNMKQLEFLDLDNNNIRQLDANVFANFESIRFLLLSQNKLTCLSEDFLHTLPTSELINVENNQLDCKCLKKMQEWAKKRHVSLKLNIRAIECMQERIRGVLDSVKDTVENSAEKIEDSAEKIEDLL